ncbi:MAG: cytochrome c-type biogenesis protein CcmH [Candidatus Binataceae bacterium]|nr:cytochrome c-type biogenesis protein CcmH [Candidatus Binataceae bacterium]
MKTFLLIAAFASLLITSPSIAATNPPKTTRQEVAEGLTCQCGCGLTVANCNHPNCEFSVPVRGKIDAMIAKGMDRAQIIASFRKIYGEKVLSAPTTQGFNLFAWIIPPLALLAGIGIMALTLSRWRKTPQPAPASTPPTLPAADENDPMRRELERQLRERI